MGYLEDRMKRKNGLLPKMEFKKPKKEIPKKGKKKLEEEKQAKLAGTDSETDLFFRSQRKKMVGRCLFCNAKSMKEDDEKFHYSIAHLLPKRPVNKGGFPSVAHHEDNWIELCFWGENCHGNFDTGKITWEFIKDSKEWDVIKEKLLNILPMVAEEERKNKLYTKLNNLVYGKDNNNQR